MVPSQPSPAQQIGQNRQTAADPARQEHTPASLTRNPSAALANLQSQAHSQAAAAPQPLAQVNPAAEVTGLGARPAPTEPRSLSAQNLAVSNSERRRPLQPLDRQIGRVTFCSGARATVSADISVVLQSKELTWSVGQKISIEVGRNRVVALVYEINTDVANWDDLKGKPVHIEVELMGEVYADDTGRDRFRCGVSRYPNVGARAHEIRYSDLEVMHELDGKKSIEVGSLSQNEDVPATISVDDMLSKHFALLGTTGVGKSCAATMLIRHCLAVKPNLRVVLLDPHNEFGRTFANEAHLLDSSSLELPYWLFRYDEFEDVVFRGKAVPGESEILQDLIALAKAQYQAEKLGQVAHGTLRKSTDAGFFNADTPSPYRIPDMFKLMDEILGQLEPRYDRARLKSLRVRLDGLSNDMRYGFMFPKGVIIDNFASILASLFRLSGDGKNISILNLSGLPSDVTNAVVSVMARLSFDVAYASEGALHVLLVCEEAHRYIPENANAGFLPTRRAISKIAKEGRKYGCSIGVVSQRPSELDTTILSQCSTVFAMRLSNDRDHSIMRTAISDSGASTIAFLAALDNREAIAFGEGVAIPMRFKFTKQKGQQLPCAPGTSLDEQPGAIAAKISMLNPGKLVSRLRGNSEQMPTQPAANADAPPSDPIASRFSSLQAAALRPNGALSQGQAQPTQAFNGAASMMSGAPRPKI